MTENQAHLVYPKDRSEPDILCDSFQEAHGVWRKSHRWDAPWVIQTVATGRVIDPSSEIVDVGE